MVVFNFGNYMKAFYWFKQKNFFLALGFLMLLFFIIYCLAYILAGSKLSLKLYEKNYANTSAHWLAGKMSKASRHPEHSCLIFGPSTAREGFDEITLAANVPNMRFYNAGTTGANVQVYEVMAAIIERFNIQVDSVIVPVHGWLMQEGDHPLNSLGYTDLVNFQQALSLTSKPITKEFEVGERKEFILNAIFPLRQHARIISRHIRYSLYKIHNFFLKEKSLKLSKFELMADELVPSPTYWYSEQKRISETEIKALLPGLARFFNLEKYGQEIYTESLRRALKVLSKHSKQLYIVIMPDAKMLDEPNRSAMPHLLKLIQEFKGPHVYCVDFSDTLTDEQLRDHTHVLPSGRAILTKKMSEVLNNPNNTCSNQVINRFNNASSAKDPSAPNNTATNH